jgi:hypothetical protein
MKQMSYLSQKRSDKLSFGRMHRNHPRPTPLLLVSPIIIIATISATGSLSSSTRLVISAAAAVVAPPRDWGCGRQVADFPCLRILGSEYLRVEKAQLTVTGGREGHEQLDQLLQ